MATPQWAIRGGRGGVCVIAWASAGLATGARGQDCLWTYRQSAVSQAGFPAGAFDTARARFVVTGFVSIQSVLETWEWDPAADVWTLRSSTTPRYHQAMAYDAARGRTVMFGGYGGPGPFHVLGDTWEWDGVSWVLAATTGPSPRSDAEMAYDSNRGRVVLFGGQVGSASAELWEWDGSAWTLLASGGPTGRYSHAMAYDSVRRKLVVFGGRSAINLALLGDTWEWDGQAWALAASGGPAPREGSAAAFDSIRGVTVLTGGLVNSTALTDTWEWNGVWVMRAAGGPPSTWPAIAFDPGRGRVYRTNQPGNVWEYNGAGSGQYPFIVQQPPLSLQRNPGATAVFHMEATGAAPVMYQWTGPGGVLSNNARISGADTDTLTVSLLTGADSGGYYAWVTSPCGAVRSAVTDLFVNEPPPRECYANCDFSTNPPILNINDFSCFLNLYAAASPYANCDASTINPVLNVNDFLCFLNRYAAGCP